ncbi:peptide chain release factor N(5)-glutamine methyltransferase [Candidatus Babeliales bacterium]|nr:peptide chain release factor N(5)-glutamine methyltransferase [Candidatus Babeliales bacterium]
MKYDLFTLIHNTVDTLSATPHVVQPNQEAWWIIQSIIKKTRAQLLVTREITLSDAQEKKLSILIDRRTNKREPIQYLLGSVPFCGLTISVKQPILIPRPETEEWCTKLIYELQYIRSPLKILDLCTGTGCIALALAKAFPTATVIGVDIDEDAIKLAKKNAVDNKINNVEFKLSDLFSAVQKEKFDIIVGNPPYLSPIEWESLPLDVKAWEAQKALIGGKDGLELYRKIAQEAPKFLTARVSPFKMVRKPPRIALEIGFRQYEDVHTLMKEALPENEIELWKDLSEKPRVTVLR